MENNKKNILQVIGDWISTLLLGDTKIKIGEMGKDIDNIKEDIKEIRPDLKDVREKVSGMVPQIDKLWQKVFVERASPLVLNEQGRKLFNESGIKDIIDKQKEALLNAIQQKNPQNAYDIQELSKQVIESLKENSEILNQLKDDAFKLGVGIEDILFVGSIYLRDIALERFGFKPEDLDKQ